MTDDIKPYSEVVREFGTYHVDRALTTADEWRSWAEQLDELIRDMPRLGVLPPMAYNEDGDRAPVQMGAIHVDPAKMRKLLYRVVSDADAAAAALTRAAVIAETQSDELANAFAIDEAEGVLVPVDVEPVEIPPGHLPCPECSALPYRPHDPDCPTLVPVVVAEDGTPATLDALTGGEPRG